MVKIYCRATAGDKYEIEAYIPRAVFIGHEFEVQQGVAMIIREAFILPSVCRRLNFDPVNILHNPQATRSVCGWLYILSISSSVCISLR